MLFDLYFLCLYCLEEHYIPLVFINKRKAFLNSQKVQKKVQTPKPSAMLQIKRLSVSLVAFLIMLS